MTKETWEAFKKEYQWVKKAGPQYIKMLFVDDLLKELRDHTQDDEMDSEITELLNLGEKHEV